jgi:hypothetical protein
MECVSVGVTGRGIETFELRPSMVILKTKQKNRSLSMNKMTRYPDYGELAGLWPEVHEYWVEDWVDTYGKASGEPSACCCSTEPGCGLQPEKNVLWPIDCL